MRSARLLVLSLFGVALAPICAQSISATDAKSHEGQKATVCGTIAEVHTATTSAGTPTFIDFEKPYPNQPFVALIWQRDQASVGKVPNAGTLCVTGLVTEYRGKPEIVLHSASDWSVTTKTALSNDNHYTNSDGNVVHSPAYSSGGVPPGATAQCADGAYSFSQHRQGTCSHHGGVAKWLQ